MKTHQRSDTVTSFSDKYLSAIIRELKKLTPKLERCAHCGSNAEGGIEDSMRLNVMCLNPKCRSKMIEQHIDDVTPKRACKALEKRWNRRGTP